MDGHQGFRAARSSLIAASLFLAAAVASRTTIVASEGSYTLVWPAAGVGVVWLLSGRSRRGLVRDVVLLGLANVAVDVAGGLSMRMVLPLAGSAVLGTLVTVLVLRRFDPALSGTSDGRPLRTPESVVRFLVAAGIGCAVGTSAGAASFAVVTGDFSSDLAALWWGRNVCGVLATGVPGILLVDHLRSRPRPPLLPGSTALELVAVGTVSVAIVAADALADLPLSFLLVAVTVWAGTRFRPIVVAFHTLLFGAATIWLTLQGHGPFAEVQSVRTAALLAQVFVGTTLVTGLLLAASREANRALEHERIEREREQREALLSFARRAAHDLQGPLAVVEGWTAELADAVRSDPLAAARGVPAMTDRILLAARQAVTLVSDLLADAAARDQAPARSCVDLTALAREVAGGHASCADIVVGEIGAVGGDAVLLRQVLGNLVDNAAKYVREGARATISVTGRRVGDVVVVRVTDDGVGIPPGQHERIFDEFERAHTDSYPGTGLGLSICRRIVERHGGRIRALDRDDGRPGAVFELTLPAWGADLRPRVKVTT